MTEDIHNPAYPFNTQKTEVDDLSLVMQETRNAVIITDKEGKIIWVNKAFERITGYTPAEAKGKKPGSFLQGKDTDPATIAYLREQIKKAQPFSCEIMNYSKAGKAYWMQIFGQPVSDESGKIVRFFSIQEEITARKEVEKKLEEQRKFYENILNEMPSDIAVFDKDQHYLFVNPPAIPDEKIRKWVIGKTEADYLSLANKPADIVAGRASRFNEVLHSKQSAAWEEVFTNAKGNREYYLRNWIPVLDEQGDIKMVIGYGSDITERKKIEEQLALNEKRYRDLYNYSQALICTHDLTGKLLSVNPAICETLGYTSEEMIGRQITDFFPPYNVANFEEFYLSIVLREGKSKGVFSVLNKKGQKLSLLYQNFKVEEDGMEPYIIGFSQDITDRIKAEKELILAKEATESASNAKELFLVNMSHEIRTPMNGILGIGALMAKTKLTPKQKQFMNLIIESGNNLLHIVNDILDITKIQSGQFILENTIFDLAHKIRATLGAFQFKAEDSGIALIFENNLKKEVVVEGDPYRLGQVINNLVGNAFKFTKEGSIVVSVQQLTEDAEKPVFEIRVSDTGMGISDENLPTIFDRFVQASADITRKFGGSGLGLSICKNLIEMQGGKISVESKINAGSTFIVQIPYKPGSPVLLKKELPKSSDYTSIQKKKILVAEDVPVNQLIAKHILQGWGHTVSVAANGKEVLKMLKKNTYDLILMDIYMPEMDGLAATRAIRKLSNRKKAYTPIIAVTAAAFKDETKHYIDAGMNDYLIKPYSEEHLFETIKKVLADHEISNPQPQLFKTGSGREEKPLEKLYDLSSMEELAAGDDAFMHEIIDTFITNSGKDLELLQIAVKAGNLADIFQLIHRMKSSIATMGIHSLQPTIKALEACSKHHENPEQIPHLFAHFQKVLLTVFKQLSPLLTKK